MYAIDANGDLFYYRDEARDGTSALAFNGEGQKIGYGWNFEHIFSGGDGIIYGINANGDLLYYRDQARDGTSDWAFNGEGQKIGYGWNFEHVFSGGDGIIYAISLEGLLLWFRDLARDGGSNWAYAGTGQTIGSGWFVSSAACVDAYAGATSVGIWRDNLFPYSRCRTEYCFPHLGDS